MKTQSGHWLALSGGDSSLSVCQAAGCAISLRLSGQVCWADSDRYSLYFALLCDSLEEVVHPALWDKFYTCKTECFSWNKWNEREPGLFKSEFKGTHVIALCRKFYFGKNEKWEKVKLSSKGVQQHRIKLHWDWCKAVLEGGGGEVDTATNRGLNGGVMGTYEQDKLGLSAYYEKHCVLEDGIDREPPLYHIQEEEPWERELWEILWDGRQLGVDRHDKKFLTNKATLGAVVQMIPNRFIGLGNVFFMWFFQTRAHLWLFSFHLQVRQV